MPAKPCFGRPWVLCLAFLLSLQGASAPQSSLVRLVVIGDSGTGDEHQYRIAEQMVAWHDGLPYGLVLMLGDNIYGGVFGRGGGNKKDFEAKFDRPYAELLRRGVVFRAALGNHDLQSRQGRDLIESTERFHIKSPQGYYSFTAGQFDAETPLVEFFVLNTLRLEKDKRDPEQLAWLGQALTASRARWRIVYGHHPLYSTGKRHGSDVKLREKLEPLLTGETGGAQGPALPKPPARVGEGLVPSRASLGPRVQVVLAGHDHLYQRFHPQKGIVYFVCGSSGKLRRGNARRSPQVAAVEDQQRAFMLWEATPEELRYRAINEQGQAFDCGVIRLGRVEAVGCAALGRGLTEARD
ncbi:MAG: metallophosphoesterase [Acidobacteria bacterium]|nr:metallophosphoesterase [Acidobacteriota bacterium]